MGNSKNYRLKLHIYSPKATQKKWVFNSFLKAEPDSAERMLCGMAFQSRGADDAKARSPHVLVFDFGTTRNKSRVDLRVRPESRTVRSSDKHLGARPFRHLYVINKILKSILKLIGSQCRVFKRVKTGILENRGTDKQSLAALF